MENSVTFKHLIDNALDNVKRHLIKQMMLPLFLQLHCSEPFLNDWCQLLGFEMNVCMLVPFKFPHNSYCNHILKSY